jgi:predicted HNH restriction endonuclease
VHGAWFDELLKRTNNFSLGVQRLKEDKFINGLISAAAAAGLDWESFLRRYKVEADEAHATADDGGAADISIPEEVAEAQVFVEGARLQIWVNSYERNPAARRRCIEHYGLSCCVCEFNFGEAFGEPGEGLIFILSIDLVLSVTANAINSSARSACRELPIIVRSIAGGSFVRHRGVHA